MGKVERKTLFLKPAPGCMVRDPETRQFLSEDGEEKPSTVYWKRRIRMRDVVEADTKRKTKQPKKTDKTMSADQLEG